MKAVMLSIQPKWCELIASGKKTVEVRKTKPKIDVPFKCYIYCTQGKDWLTSVNGVVQKPNNLVLDITKNSKVQELNGKVIGEFVCDKVVEFLNDCYDPSFMETSYLSCVGEEELCDYLGTKESCYGWHITDLVIYDKPKDLCDFGEMVYNGDWYIFDRKRKAPQSWYYVDELKGETE